MVSSFLPCFKEMIIFFRSMRERTSREAGCSILELLVIMAITAAIIMMSLVFRDFIHAGRLSTAAALVAQDIRLTQQLNMNQDATYLINFDCQNNKYYITRLTKVTKRVNLPAGIELVRTNFDFDDTASNGYDNRLGFNTRGEPIRKNSGYLYGGHVVLRDKNGKLLYVIVASITGRVRIDTNPPL